jgi:hypothetical protein
MNRQNGQSLIQAMVGMAVMAIGMLAFMQMQGVQQTSAISNQTLISRNLLQLQLQQLLANNAALTRTTNDSNPADVGNQSLKSCIQIVGTSCNQTVGPVGFYLFDPLGNKITGAGNAAPIRYDYRGSLCNPQVASPQCLFEVYTEYIATCPSGVSPCSAPFVTATFTIQQSPGITPIGKTPLKPLKSGAIPLTTSGESSGGPSSIVTQTFGCPCNCGGPCNAVITHNLNKMVVAGVGNVARTATGGQYYGDAIVAQDLNTITVRCTSCNGYTNTHYIWYYK